MMPIWITNVSRANHPTPGDATAIGLVRRWTLPVVAASLVWIAAPVVCWGPGTALSQEPPIINVVQGSRLKDYSWTHVEPPPPPPQIKVHDIITIEVDEKSEVIVNSRFNRQRQGSYKAQLKSFIGLNDWNLVNTATNTPTVEGTLQNRLQTIGQATDSEGITYKIAATIVDVLPNGTIVLEARKSIRTNQDFFEYRLSGRIDKNKIMPDRTARTEHISELKIERTQRGKIFDSTKVNWGTRFLDLVLPF